MVCLDKVWNLGQYYYCCEYKKHERQSHCVCNTPLYTNNQEMGRKIAVAVAGETSNLDESSSADSNKFLDVAHTVQDRAESFSCKGNINSSITSRKPEAVPKPTTETRIPAIQTKCVPAGAVSVPITSTPAKEGKDKDTSNIEIKGYESDVRKIASALTDPIADSPHAKSSPLVSFIQQLSGDTDGSNSRVISSIPLRISDRKRKRPTNETMDHQSKNMDPSALDEQASNIEFVDIHLERQHQGTRNQQETQKGEPSKEQQLRRQQKEEQQLFQAVTSGLKEESDSNNEHLEQQKRQHDQSNNDDIANNDMPDETDTIDEEKPKFKAWSENLHRQLVEAVYEIGLSHASPAVIMEHMTSITAISGAKTGGTAPMVSSAFSSSNSLGGNSFTGRRDSMGIGSSASVKGIVYLDSNNNPVTSERVKSHLQKYRKNKQKSKDEFMNEYDLWMQRALTVGVAASASSNRPASASMVLELLGAAERRLLGGDSAAFLTYAVMLQEQEEGASDDGDISTSAGGDESRQSKRSQNKVESGTSASLPEAESGLMLQTEMLYSVDSNMNLKRRYPSSSSLSYLEDPENKTKLSRLSGARIPFPVLTEEERRSSLGVSISHVIGLFYSMTHHLISEREKKEKMMILKNEDGSDHSQQGSINSFVVSDVAKAAAARAALQRYAVSNSIPAALPTIARSQAALYQNHQQPQHQQQHLPVLLNANKLLTAADTGSLYSAHFSGTQISPLIHLHMGQQQSLQQQNLQQQQQQYHQQQHYQQQNEQSSSSNIRISSDFGMSSYDDHQECQQQYSNMNQAVRPQLLQNLRHRQQTRTLSYGQQEISQQHPSHHSVIELSSTYNLQGAPIPMTSVYESYYSDFDPVADHNQESQGSDETNRQYVNSVQQRQQAPGGREQ